MSGLVDSPRFVDHSIMCVTRVSRLADALKGLWITYIVWPVRCINQTNECDLCVWTGERSWVCGPLSHECDLCVLIGGRIEVLN